MLLGSLKAILKPVSTGISSVSGFASGSVTCAYNSSRNWPSLPRLWCTGVPSCAIKAKLQLLWNLHFTSMALGKYILVLLTGILTALYTLGLQNKIHFQNEDINRILNRSPSTTAWNKLSDRFQELLHLAPQITFRSHIYNPANAGEQKLSSNSYYTDVSPLKNRQKIGKENATLVMLVRNSELKGALLSMRSLEDRFNRNYKYPWVFLNDVPFDDEFIEQTSLMASGEVFYELIPELDWNPPPHIDLQKFEHNLQNSNHVIYGFSRSYRNMCHFNSGYFYKQKRLLDYDWYFRVEPDVEYMCDFLYDPFELLRTLNKTYGFVITIPDYFNTMPTLWSTVKDYMAQYPQHLHPNNALEFLTSNDSDIFHNVKPLELEYNLCHFWSNFEIGNLNFFRGEAYELYFNFLDQTGGFYYERWGDAPVHSIGLSLLLDKDEIHHFEDIGYYHAPYMSCPQSRDVLTAKRCICHIIDVDNKERTEGMDTKLPSCLGRWWRYGAGKKFLNEFPYTFE